MDYFLLFVFYVFLCSAVLSVSCRLVVAVRKWMIAWLSSVLWFSCVFVTFSYV